MGLSNTDHDVVGARPEELHPVMATGPNADAYVIGIDDPIEALDLVTVIRASRPGAPVLLVAGRAPGWTAVTAHRLDATEVVPLPVTRPALLDALDRLLGQTPAPDTRLEALPDPPATTAETVPVTPVSETTDAVARPPQPVEESAPQEEDAGVPPGVLKPAVNALDMTEPHTLPAVAPAPPRDDLTQTDDEPAPVSAATGAVDHDGEAAIPSTPSPYGGIAAARLSSQRLRAPSLDLSELRATIVDQPPEAVTPSSGHHKLVDTTTPTRAAAGTDAAAALVRQLLAVADGVAGLAEVGEIVVAEAVTHTVATAGALLLPDGEVWRVAGGVRLRALERRCQLDANSWLIATVAHGDRGVIIEDTDIARQRLHGAPLANRHQLLAAPVPVLHGVLLLGRDELPFGESDLETLAAVGREAVEPLREALESRELARRLNEFRDVPE
jgi:hypothetical protein